MANHRGFLLFLPVIWLLLLTSCIRDDLSDCPPESNKVQINFTYDTPYGPRTFEKGELKIAHLYIFNDKGEYINTLTYHSPELYKTYTLDIDLLPGKYEFIVWFNKDEFFDVRSSDSNEIIGNPLNHADILHLVVPEEGYIATPLPLILYGDVDEKEITGSGHQLVSIPLEQNTNTINVTVKGLPKTGNSYFQVITDRNSNETFRNEPARGTDFHYVAPMSRKAATDLTSSLRVLKLYQENQPKFILWNETEKKELYPGNSGLPNNLIGLILERYPDVDFRTTHVFDIILTYDTSMNVSVDVRYWNDMETDYEIEPD